MSRSARFALTGKQDYPPFTFTSHLHLFLTQKEDQMAKKICGFQSRKITAFLAGLLTGVLIGGCSVVGPGIGASVY